MKKSKFTEEQIAVALHQHEAGIPVGEVTRKLGFRSRPSIAGRRGVLVAQKDRAAR